MFLGLGGYLTEFQQENIPDELVIFALGNRNMLFTSRQQEKDRLIL